MSQILRPTIDFTNTVRNRAKVSFDVSFTNSEIAGASPHVLRGGFPGARQPSFPPSYSYFARVVLKVIRVVPRPFVKGQPPPPVPDPVMLQLADVPVKMPKSGNITSHGPIFTYQLLGTDPLIWDTLFADITLMSVFRIGFDGSSFLTAPVASGNTNYLQLEGVNLQSPQDNGIEIPT